MKTDLGGQLYRKSITSHRQGDREGPRRQEPGVGSQWKSGMTPAGF